MIMTVCNLKGGTAKTTSAGYLAHGLAALGHEVLLIDADPQCSMTRWAEIVDKRTPGAWSIPVRGMATGQLHSPVTGVALEARGRYDVIVIDTPPTDDHAHIVESAVRAATHVIVPVAPTTPDIERMATVRRLVSRGAELTGQPTPPVVAALLVKCVAQAASTGIFREQLTSAGWRVLRAQVARLERYASSWGFAIERPLETAYGDALRELAAAAPAQAIA